MRREPREPGTVRPRVTARQKGRHDYRIPEVRDLEAGPGSPYMDPTEEDEFCSGREVGTKGCNNILVQRLIDTVRT